MKKKILSLASLALLTSSGVFAAGFNSAVVVEVDDQAPLANVTLATGSDSSADGHLSITVDDYGAWGDFGAGEAPDTFNPDGKPSSELVAFTAGFFIFQGSPRGRELLAESANWQAVFPPDDSLDRTVLVGNIASDSSGNGVNDRAISRFSVTGPVTDLTFDLEQTVASAGPGVATMTQNYTVTNNSASSVAFDLVRSFDGDLLWGGDFTNDEVGTTTQADGSVSAFMQEDSLAGSTRVTIASDTADAYYGGKNGLTPGNGGPPYGFGTDVQIWDNFGVPGTWRNHIAGVGYDTDGESGTEPAGCDTGNGCDGFAGISIPVSLDAGASTTVTVVHTYGGEATGGSDPELTITGTCPGNITLELTGATPNAVAGIMNGTGLGGDVIPGGPCNGTGTGLSGLGLLNTLTTDGTGAFSLDVDAPAAACGFNIQVIDTGACAVSNVDQIP